MVDITADSKPIYGLLTLNTWGCQDWITWHKAMVKAYGIDIANQRFIPEWNDQSIWSNDYNWCKYDPDFVKYFNDAGTTTESGSILSIPVVTAKKILTDVSNAASNVGSGISNTTKVVSYIVPALIIATSIGLIWYGYKTYLKSA